MKKLRNIAAVGLTLIAAFARIWVEQHRQAIIIEKGVSGFRSQAATLTTILVFMAVLTLLIFILEAVRDSAQKKKEEPHTGDRLSKEARNAGRKARATLSVQGTLDPEKIRELLLQQAEGEWHRYRGNISLCVGVMDQMTECLDRLDTLLSMNGAETLRDTEDVLRQVQQYICRNMRKVINYLSAVDVDSPEAEEGIRQRFTECISDSSKKLDKVNEFLISLSDFLNSQGDDTSSLDMLDIYRDTILESIHGSSAMPG
ncbi:MAG: hypothetical protein Q4C02_06865 [Eubacteriales bacterium]|nr:hypothetical protein [Sarcina sp.]MDO4417984.1 hypothetical protein [Eubacteriales bacterium]